MELTDTQQAILALIGERIASDGVPPSQTEIARAFGFHGVRGAQYHLEALEAAGAIRRIPGQARGIRLVHTVSDSLTDDVLWLVANRDLARFRAILCPAPLRIAQFPLLPHAALTLGVWSFGAGLEFGPVKFLFGHEIHWDLLGGSANVGTSGYTVIAADEAARLGATDTRLIAISERYCHLRRADALWRAIPIRKPVLHGRAGAPSSSTPGPSRSRR
mgnify:CR=1 FL=1